MKKYALLVVAVPLLGACSDEQTASLQNQASAAIGSVHQVVRDSSAPLVQLKQQASAAIGSVHQVVRDSSAPLAQIQQQASAAIGAAKRLSDAAELLQGRKQ